MKSTFFERSEALHLGELAEFLPDHNHDHVAMVPTGSVTKQMQESMEKLRASNVEWGMLHAVVAQHVLQRPICLALPVDGGDMFHTLPLNDVVSTYLLDTVEVPSAPDGAPLYVLPTRASL